MTRSGLSREEAKAFMVGHHGLRAMRTEATPDARLQGLVNALRCIQLDPLDVLGTNADLVALARIDGIQKGDVYSKLMPGHAFEHWAKQRCILPAGGATLRMPERAGVGNAMLHLLTADEFDAAEAYRCNFVQKVVPVAEVMDTALGLARRIAAQAPQAGH